MTRRRGLHCPARQDSIGSRRRRGVRFVWPCKRDISEQFPSISQPLIDTCGMFTRKWTSIITSIHYSADAAAATTSAAAAYYNNT